MAPTMTPRYCALLAISWTLLTLGAAKGPWVLRVSCGAFLNVHTPPTSTFWHKDFSYTGGVPFNATPTSFLTPQLSTLRYFPLSSGPNNCYNLPRVPRGHFAIRVFFGLLKLDNFDDEPLFDVSIDGTLIYSLQPGWSTRDDRSFVEARAFLYHHTASVCFHSTGHGDPAIISLEVMQIDDRAYVPDASVILRTAHRLNCGNGKPMFDVDMGGSDWGGDRFWLPTQTFGLGSDLAISAESPVNVSSAPNFYPAKLYQHAIVGSDSRSDLSYTLDVEPNRNYSVWLHFAEINEYLDGEREFDVSINGDSAFPQVNIKKMAGGRFIALVLNKTVAVDGRSLTVTLTGTKGYPLISAIEVLEIIPVEAKTLNEEVKMMGKLKTALGLPARFGWNGDPCVPQQHPWSGADCQFDKTSGNWFIDGLALDNQGLGGYLPSDLSRLNHLVNVNLSGNSIQGGIPPSIGNITSLEVLDLSYNNLNGSIPETLGQLTALRLLDLNGNSLSGRVPAALGGRLLHGATFNFTDNSGLCGIPGLASCGSQLSTGVKIGIGFSALLTVLVVVICVVVCWKRQKNIQRAQVAARGAPYAKARTNMTHDIQLARHTNNGNHSRASESGPILHS